MVLSFEKTGGPNIHSLKNLVCTIPPGVPAVAV